MLVHAIFCDKQIYLPTNALINVDFPALIVAVTIIALGLFFFKNIKIPDSQSEEEQLLKTSGMAYVEKIIKNLL